jgi:hypothetical protein
MPTDAVALAPQNALLVEFVPRNGGVHPLAEGLERLAAELGVSSAHLRAYQALEAPRIIAYLRGAPLEARIHSVRALARERLGRLAEGEIEVSRLEGLRAIAGASAAAAADYHYVVRTDVEPGGELELERWYDQEHMPSLAAVPGAVLAQRLLSLDGGPRYYACYDLTSPEVLKSPPWLAVRGTDWSSRVRPTFRDTRRTMTRRLPWIGL